MATVTAATPQNVQLRASEQEIRAIGASGVDVAVQGRTVLLSQAKFVQLFGRTAQVGQSFDVSSQRFAEPEPEPAPVPVERPEKRFVETAERVQAVIEKAERKRARAPPPPVRVTIPEEVRRGERQLPVFDVIDVSTGLPISKGEVLDIEFAPRPPPLARPIRRETVEFVSRPAAIAEREAQAFEIERRITELPERLRAGVIGGFEQLRTVPGRKPRGAELFAESFVVGTVTGIPALPATIFSIISKPVETGRALLERAITRPVEFAGETLGAAAVFGGIGRGLGRFKAPKPTPSVDIGKAFQVSAAGRPATLIITKGLVRVGRKEFRVIGKALTIETGAVGEFLGVGRAAIAKISKLKRPPKPKLIDIAVVGKEIPSIIPKTRVGLFVGALKGAKIKDIFAGRFISQKQAGITKALTITAARRGKLGVGLSLIEEFKPPLKPTRLPRGVVPVTKTSQAIQAALQKAIVEAPIIKRAVRIEQIKTIVPEAATITGLSVKVALKETAAARARAELFITPRQLTKQEVGITPAVAVTQARVFKRALKTRQKIAEELTTRQELKQPTMVEQARSFRQMFGQTQAQAQKQALKQKQRQALRQRTLRRQFSVSLAAPTFIRGGFGFPIIPRVDSRFGFGRGEPRQFRFREIINPLGTPEQILGLPRRRKKRRRKKK